MYRPRRTMSETAASHAKIMTFTFVAAVAKTVGSAMSLVIAAVSRAMKKCRKVSRAFAFASDLAFAAAALETRFFGFDPGFAPAGFADCVILVSVWFGPLPSAFRLCRASRKRFLYFATVSFLFFFSLFSFARKRGDATRQRNRGERSPGR